MSYYRLDVQGLASGQQVQNTFYYRDKDLSLATWIASPYARAAALVGAWYQSFVHDSDGPLPTDGNYWCQQLHNSYQLTGFSCSVRGEGVGFPIETASPFVFGVNPPLSGQAGGDTDGPDAVAIIAFGLAAGPVTSGFYQPRRRRIFQGPIGSTWIGNDGKLANDFKASNDALAAKLANEIVGNSTRYSGNLLLQALLENLTELIAIGPAQILIDLDNIRFEPMGYGRGKWLGVLDVEGYAKVQTGITRPYISRLRSRRTPPNGN